MSPFVFIHIPKTAGTSFRLGAENFFGSERICCDYGLESSETSKEVIEWVWRNPDGWRFKKTFEKGGYQFLTGHFHAGRYVPIFGVGQMLTFLRDPIQRITSEYWHFVRHNGFDGDFETFYRTKSNINRQIRILGNLPWPALGFIGFTEFYDESVFLLNRKFGLEIPTLSENLSRDRYTEPYELSSHQIAELRQLNAIELTFFQRAREQFEWRRILFERGQLFVAGALMRVEKGRLLGWAVSDDVDDAVAIQAAVGGNVFAESIANENRPSLRERGVRRGGFVGFSFDVSHLRPGTLVDCTVAKTGQPLVLSPWRIRT